MDVTAVSMSQLWTSAVKPKKEHMKCPENINCDHLQ